ncbi:MarR family transcriptional regulator [candidate division GN15 bacterium]|nr:MarR family transcriptional regulator [candidate division GN15 bacterium]
MGGKTNMTKAVEESDKAVFANLFRTFDRLNSELSQVLKEFGISEPQFNALRILRGAGEPLSCHEIGERMITRVPDITRLLDRLEQRGLIERRRSESDRRVIFVSISADGRALLKRLDRPVAKYQRERLAHLSERERTQLVRLLGKLRQA